MEIPTYDQFIFPLLRVLAAHPDGLRAADAYERVAEAVGLNDEQKALLLPSGRQEIYKNRIGWAHDRLKRAGYSHSPSWGRWQLTEHGRVFHTEHASGIPADTLDRLAQPDRYKALESVPQTLEEESAAELVATSASGQTPEEQIDSALRDLQESVAAELLEQIFAQSPAFFEQLVLDVLGAMGYGAGKASIVHHGASHDGGIDGIISLDKLGLEKVYVQAKRWKDTVGRPDVQAFFGALAGRKATKGVFITTSSYSKEAVQFVSSVSDSIVLIDGARLTKLMIEYEVGVQIRRVVKVVELDRDYFEND